MAYGNRDPDADIKWHSEEIARCQREIQKIERQIHQKGQNVKHQPPSLRDERGDYGWSSKRISDNEFANLRRKIQDLKSLIRHEEESIDDIRKHRNDNRNTWVSLCVVVLLMVVLIFLLG